MEPIPPSPTSPPSLPSEMPRRDTGTTMQVAVENVEEQPVHVPMSSHFETAFVTVKSIVAGMYVCECVCVYVLYVTCTQYID